FRAQQSAIDFDAIVAKAHRCLGIAPRIAIQADLPRANQFRRLRAGAVTELRHRARQTDSFFSKPMLVWDVSSFFRMAQLALAVRSPIFLHASLRRNARKATRAVPWDCS